MMAIDKITLNSPGDTLRTIGLLETTYNCNRYTNILIRQIRRQPSFILSPKIRFRVNSTFISYQR